MSPTRPIFGAASDCIKLGWAPSMADLCSAHNWIFEPPVWPELAGAPELGIRHPRRPRLAAALFKGDAGFARHRTGRAERCSKNGGGGVIGPEDSACLTFCCMILMRTCNVRLPGLCTENILPDAVFCSRRSQRKSSKDEIRSPSLCFF